MQNAWLTCEPVNVNYRNRFKNLSVLCGCFCHLFYLGISKLEVYSVLLHVTLKVKLQCLCFYIIINLQAYRPVHRKLLR